MKRSFWIIAGLTVAILVPLVAVHAADTTKPILRSFSTTTPNGTYGAGANITIDALYSEPLATGSTLTAVLNTSPVEKEVVLTVVSGFKVSGAYTVAVGDNSARLKVVRIKAGTESVRDSAGNVRTDTPSSAYAGSKNIDSPEKIVIDTVAPLTPIASPKGGFYNTSRNITLSVAGEPSTTKIYYTLDGTNPTVTSPRYSSKLLIATSKTIKAVARDAAGNISPIMTEVYVIDTEKPQLLSFSSETPNGTYGVGKVISILANYNESLKSGSTITVKLNTIPEKTLVLSTTTDANSFLKGQYTVAAGDKTNGNLKVASIVTTPNSAKEDVKDLAGNIRSNSTLPTGANCNLGNCTTASSIVINTTVPTPTPTVTPTPTPTPIINPYDGQTPIPTSNGYDAQTITPNPYTNSYTNPIVTALTAIITSPANNSFFAQGQNIPVAVSGNGSPSCGTWTLTKPNGQTVTLTAADFAEGKLPGNIPSCTSASDTY